MSLNDFFTSIAHGWRAMFNWLNDFELMGFSVLEFSLCAFCIWSLFRFVLLPALGDKVGLRSFGKLSTGASDSVKRVKESEFDNLMRNKRNYQ